MSISIELSTMTLDGLITNVRFDKVHAIETLGLTDNIVEIGCNYGHKISEEYLHGPFYKCRIKKKTSKVFDTRRKQGLGTHFNSQITFTLITDVDPTNTYQVKLFTNGRVQIPGIGKCIYGSEVLLDNMIEIIISYVKRHASTLMFRPYMDVNIINIAPILQNYKSITIGSIDCNRPDRFCRDKHGMLVISVPFINLNLFEIEVSNRKTLRDTQFGIRSVAFNPERYAGMLIKFSTPRIVTGIYTIDKLIEMSRLYYHVNAPKNKPKQVNNIDIDAQYKRPAKIMPDDLEEDDEDNDDTLQYLHIIAIVRKMQNYWYENNKAVKKIKAKLTTVKLFKTGKINMDHANNKEQAAIIRSIVSDTLNRSWDQVVFYPME